MVRMAGVGGDFVISQCGTLRFVENSYWERTDSFERKMKLVEAAWAKKDYRLARALLASLRSTAVQAQAEEESLGEVFAGVERPVTELPAAWQAWAKGWTKFQVLQVDETAGVGRPPEPVEIVLKAAAGNLARETRVALVDGGRLREVPCQVFSEIRRGKERLCRLLFFASGGPHQRQTFLVLYGNPDAELPEYPSDLRVAGEGYGLDIENDFFKASLSRQMGQLERLAFKREHGLELFAGGEGHGEPPGIDWAHDYVGSGNFQKLRITLWDQCPDYEVIRGPLCTVVRRWGFPHSPVHPVFSPARIHFDVEYRFYAGVPWFMKSGRVDVVQDVEIDALRDDEWVFSGQSFTEMVWMGPDGKLKSGPVEKELAEKLWGVGFYHKTAEDAFIALFLEHRGEGTGELRHNASPQMFYKWHGPVWSRYPLHPGLIKAGTVLHQKNAYLALRYTEADGPRLVEGIRHRMKNPLAVTPGGLGRNLTAESVEARLARPGEAGDAPVSKQAIWEALRDCKDEQLYKSDLNVVDLGLVYDVRVRADTVHLVMAMPHRGRPRLGFFSYGSGGNSMPVRQRLMRIPGVRRVVFEQAWEPGWSSNRLTEEGRRKFGL
jgi:metal-sulfur cluster biosynthetic enzyme